MFRTSLKRSHQDYSQLHQKLNETVETSLPSFSRSIELPNQSYNISAMSRFLNGQFTTTAETLKVGDDSKFRIPHVPLCLHNSPNSVIDPKQPTTSPLIIEDMQVPSEVDRILKTNNPLQPICMGNSGSLYWLAQDSQLTIWSAEDNENVLLKHKFDSKIFCVAYGLLRGVVMHTNNEMEVFAIATNNQISIYSYSSTMLDELNINIGTNNEVVNWMRVQKQGIFYGGDEGILKFVSNRETSNKWRYYDSQSLPWLRSPLLVGMIMDKGIQQVEFSSNNVFIYGLMVKKYRDDWLSRKLLWKNGCDTQKEIHVYTTNNNITLFCKIHEHKFIAQLRRRYPSVANVSINNLRIQNIYVTQDNALNACLTGGIFVQILNPITMQMNKPLFYLNCKQTSKIYERVSGKIFEELSGSVQPSSIGKIGLVATSLGVNNLTVFSDPTQFIFNDIANLQISSVQPNQQALISEEKEPGSIFADTLSRSKQIGAYGQLLQLQPSIVGFKLENKLSKSVLVPNREWLYLQQANIKRIKKLRLLDLTLVLINAHYEIASRENLGTPQIHALQKSLRNFLTLFGIVNVCECILEIILARNLQITVPESVYFGTLQASQETGVNEQSIPVNVKGFRKIENRPELKVFAQKLLDRLSREVLKNNEVSNVYYNNLMERVLQTTESTSADTMWYVLLKYFHSLFGVVRNEKISFFRKERRFCCFIREKLELLKRFLMRKYEELELVNLDPVSRKPYVSEGFEWMVIPNIKTATSTEVSPPIDRFSQQTTKTLMFYMISTVGKIQILMELFERLGIEGSEITIKLCLTNQKVAQQVRNIILSQFKIGDSYLEELQTVVPQVVSYPDIIFHTWEQKPQIEQLKMDLRQAVIVLNEEQLNKLINRFKTAENGYDRIVQLLLYRLEKIDDDLLSLGQRDSRMNVFIRDSITTSATNMQIDLKEVRRQETIDCIKKLLRDMIKQLKLQHQEKGLRCLASVLKRIKKFVEVSKRAEQTRIRLENQKPVSTSYTKLDSIVKSLLQEYFVPQMQQLYKGKQVNQQSTILSPFDQFIASSMLSQQNHLQVKLP